MKQTGKSSYLLSTGKVIHPNEGIIGLTEVDGALKIYEGYDGSWVVESEIEGSSYTKDDIELTNNELIEIATYMSKQFQKLVDRLTQTITKDGWHRHPETVPDKIDIKYKIKLNDDKGTEAEDYFMGTHWHDYDYSEIGWWKEITEQQ